MPLTSASGYAAAIAKATVQKNIGNGHFKKDEFEKAIEFFDKALTMLPDDKLIELQASSETADIELVTVLNNIRTNRVVSASKLGRWLEVMDDCNKVCGQAIVHVRNDKYVNRCLWFRAKAYEALGQTMNAFYDYRRAETEEMLKK
jgi:tetratricopeptide (TPR) repeat protein